MSATELESNWQAIEPSPSGDAVVRDARGRFVLGTAANPGGRPRAIRHLVELAREHTELAVGALAEIVADRTAPKSDRITAASALLDRGWGKPVQATIPAVTVNVGSTQISPPLFDRIAELTRRQVEVLQLMEETE